MFMQRLGSDKIVSLDSELLRTLRKIRKDKRQDAELLHESMENLEGFKEKEAEIQLTSWKSIPPPAPPWKILKGIKGLCPSTCHTEAHYSR